MIRSSNLGDEVAPSATGRSAPSVCTRVEKTVKVAGEAWFLHNSGKAQVSGKLSRRPLRAGVQGSRRTRGGSRRRPGSAAAVTQNARADGLSRVDPTQAPARETVRDVLGRAGRSARGFAMEPQ